MSGIAGRCGINNIPAHSSRHREGGRPGVSKFAAFILVGVAGVAGAQGVAPLPKSLSGRWSIVVPGVRAFNDTMSMTLDAPVQPGPVTGRLTARGVGCGAENEPLTGTWDGTTLRVESRVYPNVNVQRMNGECGSGQVVYTLTRKPGQSTFEGEGKRDGMTGAVLVTLSP
jgi:hypothetical protein